MHARTDRAREEGQAKTARLIALVAVGWFALAASALAAPPKLTIPAEVKPVGGYVRFTPDTDAVSVVYVSLDGLDPFPSEELKDPRRFLLPIAGVKDGKYRFAAVAASKDGEQARADFVVSVGTGVSPPTTTPPPTNPPTNPPTQPTKGLYFLIVRANGPASPELTKAMSLPAWAELEKAGHLYKDKTLSEAATLGVTLPDGTSLPAVVILREAADGKTAKQVGGPVPLPTTDAGVRELPTKAVK